jgi:hypothetical protein
MTMQSPLSPAADMPPHWLWAEMCQERAFRTAPRRAPKNTPAEIAEKLNKDINTALAILG